MADELTHGVPVQGGGEVSPSPQSPPPSPAQPQGASPAPVAPQMPQGGDPTASPAPGSASAASDYQGVRDALAGYGVDLRQQFPDDHAALQHLALAYRQAQQSNQLAQYGQQYIQHASEFQQYLAQRQAQQQALASQQQEWFKAPEYDARWASQITRDPTTGGARPVPGAPPDVVQKYTAWAQHQADFQQKLARDPIGTLRPGLEQVTRQVAAEMIQQQLGQYQEQQAAASFISQHSSWLHARDATGNIVQDPQTGREQLSPLGRHFLGYVREAESLGLRSVADVQRHALRALRADVAMASLQGQQSGQSAPQAAPQATLPPGEAAKAAFLASAAAGHHPGTSVAPVMPNGAQVPQNGSLSARDRLTAAFQAQGYNLSTPIPGREP